MVEPRRRPTHRPGCRRLQVARRTVLTGREEIVAGGTTQDLPDASVAVPRRIVGAFDRLRSSGCHRRGPGRDGGP